MKADSDRDSTVYNNDSDNDADAKKDDKDDDGDDDDDDDDDDDANDDDDDDEDDVSFNFCQLRKAPFLLCRVSNPFNHSISPHNRPKTEYPMWY